MQAIANTRGNGAVVITNGDCFESSAENLITEILKTILQVYEWVPQSKIEELFPYRYLVNFACNKKTMIVLYVIYAKYFC